MYAKSPLGAVSKIGHATRSGGSDPRWFVALSDGVILPETDADVAGHLDKYSEFLSVASSWKSGGKTGPAPACPASISYIYADPIVERDPADAELFQKRMAEEYVGLGDEKNTRKPVHKAYVRTANPAKTKLEGLTDARGTVWRDKGDLSIGVYVKLILAHANAIHKANVPAVSDDAKDAYADNVDDYSDMDAIRWVGHEVDLVPSDFVYFSYSDSAYTSVFKDVLNGLLSARAAVVSSRQAAAKPIDAYSMRHEMADATKRAAGSFLVKYSALVNAEGADPLLRDILSETQRTGLANLLSVAVRDGVLLGARDRGQLLREALLAGRVPDVILQDARGILADQLPYVDRYLANVTEGGAARVVAVGMAHTQPYMVVYLSTYVSPVMRVSIKLDVSGLAELPGVTSIYLRTQASLIDFIPTTLPFPVARYMLADAGALSDFSGVVGGDRIVDVALRPGVFKVNTRSCWLNELQERLVVDVWPNASQLDDEGDVHIRDNESVWFTVVVGKRVVKGMLTRKAVYTEGAFAVDILSDTPDVVGVLRVAIQRARVHHERNPNNNGIPFSGLNLTSTILPGRDAFRYVRQGKAYAKHVRETVLAKYKTGDVTMARIARDMGIGVQTVRRYIDQAKANIFDHRQGRNQAAAIRRCTRLGADQQYILYEVTRKLGSVTAEEFLELYREVGSVLGVAPLSAKASTINRWRKRMGLSYASAGMAASNQYVRSIAAATHYFETERLPALQQQRHRLIFIDETSLYLDEAPTMVWGRIGKPHTVVKNKNRGLATKLVLAVGFPIYSAGVGAHEPYVRFWTLPPRPVNDKSYNIRPLLHGLVNARRKAYDEYVLVHGPNDDDADKEPSGFVKPMYADALNLAMKTFPPSSVQQTLKVQTITGELFAMFLEYRLGIDDESKGKIICMDNAPIHHTNATVKDRLETLYQKRQWMVQWLPPYNPHYNVVELAFAYVKHYVRKNYPNTYAELVYSIKLACESIRADHVFGWFRKCGFVPRDAAVGAAVGLDGRPAPVGTAVTSTRVLVNKEERPTAYPTGKWPVVHLQRFYGNLARIGKELYVLHNGRVWYFDRNHADSKQYVDWASTLQGMVADREVLSASLLKNAPGVAGVWKPLDSLDGWKRYDDKQVYRRLRARSDSRSKRGRSVRHAFQRPIKWPVEGNDTSLGDLQDALLGDVSATLLVEHDGSIWKFGGWDAPEVEAIRVPGNVEAMVAFLQTGAPKHGSSLWTRTLALDMVNGIVSRVMAKRRALSNEAVGYYGVEYFDPAVLKNEQARLNPSTKRMAISDDGSVADVGMDIDPASWPKRFVLAVDVLADVKGARKSRTHQYVDHIWTCYETICGVIGHRGVFDKVAFLTKMGTLSSGDVEAVLGVLPVTVRHEILRKRSRSEPLDIRAIIAGGLATFTARPETPLRPDIAGPTNGAQYEYAGLGLGQSRPVFDAGGGGMISGPTNGDQFAYYGVSGGGDGHERNSGFALDGSGMIARPTNEKQWQYEAGRFSGGKVDAMDEPVVPMDIDADDREVVDMEIGE